MKECVILQYYVSDYTDEYILNICIDSITKMGLDVLLVSHSAISEKIQKKVKYFIYDGEDELVNFDDIFHGKVRLHTNKRFNTDKLEISPFLFVVDDISYTFCKAVYNIYKIASVLGYTHSYYFTADFDVHSDELLELRRISELVHSENKKGYFERHTFCASVFFWYVDNNWFLDNFFVNMNSKDEFLSDLKSLNLYCHYDLYIDYQVDRNIDELIVKDVKHCGHTFVSEDRSDLSKTFKDTVYSNDVGIFYYNDTPHIFCFDYGMKNKWTLYIEYDNNLVSKYEIGLNGQIWSMYPMSIDYDRFRLKCFNNDDKLRYNIYVDDLEQYKIKFKINES